MARKSTYRVRFKITGWVEEEAVSEEHAFDLAAEQGAVELVANRIGRLVVEFDEVELNP